MKKTCIFMANGTEEVEALTVVDLLRRAGMPIDIVSIEEEPVITSSHNVTIQTDAKIADINMDEYDAVVIPGGMPGTMNLGASEGVVEMIKKFHEEGKLVAAICAGPSVLGVNCILEGKKATCFPGFEDKLLGATHVPDPAVTDGNVITGKGMGAAIEFGLAIIRYLQDDETAERVKKTIQYRGW